MRIDSSSPDGADLPIDARIIVPSEAPSELTPGTEWFWKSGADGRLRIQRCSDCGALVHPPVPICPVCHSRVGQPIAGVGAGHRGGLHCQYPALVAGVRPRSALRDRQRRPRRRRQRSPHEQHRGVRTGRSAHRPGGRSPVRATRGCLAAAFEPTGKTDTNDRVGEPHLPKPRPPVRDDRFEHRAVLSGIGRSKIGRRLMVDPLSLTVDACLAGGCRRRSESRRHRRAVDLPRRLGIGMSEGGVTAVEEALRVHPTWINGGGDLPGPGGAVIAAMLAVATGLCRHVLCFRTVWESTFAALGLGPTAVGPPASWLSGDCRSGPCPPPTGSA